MNTNDEKYVLLISLSAVIVGYFNNGRFLVWSLNLLNTVFEITENNN